jgi:GxxExxY protein
MEYLPDPHPRDPLTREIIAAAISVHRGVGPGLLESVYKQCLASELAFRGLSFETERPVRIRYRDVALECGYRLDFIVESQVVLEVKAVERLEPVHLAQLLSYLRLTRLRVGLLMNFHAYSMRNGIRRVVNGFDNR